MPGKPYTMREMKQIVESLTERNAYGEIRGRKIWMEIADSRTIDRTWQSLKETFMKRILPDIHNPYYKLTIQQINSFRQGKDLASKNKLEVYTLSDESSSNAETNKEKDQPSTSKNIEQNNTGEDIKCSKIQERNRSSTDTLVLETCYQNDEEKDQEDPIESNEISSKSLRDCIIYTEPLTPMLQEVLHDFDTDDDEPQMQIVEDSVPEENGHDGNNSDSQGIRKSKSYDKQSLKKILEGNESNKEDEEFPKPTEPSKIKSLKLKKTQKGTWENKDPSTTNNLDDKEKQIETNNNVSKDNAESKDTSKQNTSESSEKQTQGSNTTDTQLPNNQEGLLYADTGNKRSSTESTANPTEKKEHKKKSRKRERSQTSTESRKKHKKIKNKEGSTEKHDQSNDTEGTASSEHTSIQNDGAEKNVESHIDNESKSKEDNVDNEQNKSDAVPTENCDNPEEIPPSILNPCLKSVSLFAEQHNTSKYSDSDSDIIQENVKEVTADVHQEASEPISNNKVDKTTSPQKNKSPSKVNKATDSDEVVVLQSNSESDPQPGQIVPLRSSTSSVNKSREKVLANLFGFSSGHLWPSYGKKHGKGADACGRAHSSRVRIRGFRDKTKLSRYPHRRRSLKNVLSRGKRDSDDDYTTDSDSDDSRPNELQHRILNKFAKPPPLNILSNGESGLFVAGRNRIYPLLLKERNTLHSTGLNDSDSDDVESFWKAKYLEQSTKLAEEKLRANDLAKLLESTKKLLEETNKRSESPILQRKSLPFKRTEQKEEDLSNNLNGNEVIENKLFSGAEPEPKKTVKIKFTKDREIELEGNWSQMEPMVEKMVQIINKSDDKPSHAEADKVVKDRESTVADKNDVKENTTVKDRKSESKEGVDSKIEAVRLSSDRSSRQSPQIDPEVHEKVNKIESEIFKKIEEIDKQSGDDAETVIKGSVNVTTRKRGKKFLSPAPSNTSKTSTDSKKQKMKEKVTKNIKANTRNKVQHNGVNSDNEGLTRRNARVPKKYESDADLKRVTRRAKSSGRHEPVEIPNNDPSTRYKFPERVSERLKRSSRYLSEPRIYSSPDVTRLSESTQGYQDSDVSPPKITIRKRKASLNRRKSGVSPYLGDIDSCDSNSSNISIKVPNSTVNSEVYRTESYQLLMPKSKPIVLLERIDETIPTPSVSKATNKITEIATSKAMVPLNVEVNLEIDTPSETSAPNTGSLGCNSSNTSFPLSPELSIVENLSIVKDLISDNISDHPTLNETHASSLVETANYDKYFISDVDVSVPLMAQDCDLRQNLAETSQKERAESLLKQIYSVNMEDPSITDSLDQKLQNLLLESAKKMKEKSKVKECDRMEVDLQTEVKKKATKRSSTPRKRNSSKSKPSPSSTETVEEHSMSCSYGGITSCTPKINIVYCEDPLNNNNITLKGTNTEGKVRGRKKKDVIKVKIQRPKRARSSGQSVCTDSGINDSESGVFLQDCNCCNDTVDLIHNHSDTCLQANECLGDSVEFIDNLVNSVISLHDSVSMDREPNLKASGTTEEYLTPEMFDNNAQDVSAHKPLAVNESAIGVQNVVNTPRNQSFNSLMTEDLSDDVPVGSKPTKWYLLSEDETNSNFFDARSQQSNASATSVGANLHAIFPETCAIPNLSTITENSKENDSKRFVLDNFEVDSQEF